MFNGDSINSDLGSAALPTAYYQRLRPGRWSGWCASGDDNGTGLAGGLMDFGQTQGGTAGFGSDGIFAGSGTPSSGVAGDANIWPGLFGDSGLFAGDVAADALMYFSNTVLARMALFNVGDWMSDKAVTARLVMYRSATVGMSAIGTRGRRIPSDSGNTVGSNALASGTYTNLDVSIPAVAGERSDWLLNGANPNIDETGKNFYLCGTRWYTNELGLQLGFAGVGGSGVAHWIDTARVSDTAIAAMVAAYNLNTIVIWIGQNDTIDATWNTNIIALIQRWRAAIGSSFKCLLISQYQCTGTNAAKVDAIWGYISANAHSNGDVSALDLGGTDNGYAAGQGGVYLSDGVHPTSTGALYFATLIHNEFIAALAAEDRPVRSVRTIR